VVTDLADRPPRRVERRVPLAARTLARELLRLRFRKDRSSAGVPVEISDPPASSCHGRSSPNPVIGLRPRFAQAGWEKVELWCRKTPSVRCAPDVSRAPADRLVVAQASRNTLIARRITQ